MVVIVIGYTLFVTS